MKPACVVRLQLIDVAVFEDAGCERQLLGGVVNKERAFHELATIIAGENAFAFKIKMRALETFAVDDALFRWIIRLHLFSFTPVSTLLWLAVRPSAAPEYHETLFDPVRDPPSPFRLRFV
jgi:hypothetical protein